MAIVTSSRERFGPVFEKMEAMVGAARNAFNRHSRTDMERFRQIYQESGTEINAALQQVEKELARKWEPIGLRDQSLFQHLKSISDNLGGLYEPLAKKIQGAILFSDKAVFQSNSLFDRQTGLLRTLLDIIKTNNEYLLKFAGEESRNLIQACNDFATEHEARLIEGLCQPQAAPVFLAMLDRLRAVYQREEEMVNVLAEKP